MTREERKAYHGLGEGDTMMINHHGHWIEVTIGGHYGSYYWDTPSGNSVRIWDTDVGAVFYGFGLSGGENTNQVVHRGYNGNNAVYNRFGEEIGYNPFGASYTDYSDEATNTIGGGDMVFRAWYRKDSNEVNTSDSNSGFRS
jgi:hypothetical protein